MSLSHSLRKEQLVTILLVFLHLGTHWFPLYSWRLFSLVVGFRLTVVFIQHVAYVILLPSALYGFREIHHHSDCVSHIHKVSFVLLPLRIFSLSLVFRSLAVMCVGVKFFRVYSVWGSLTSWICRFMSFCKTWELFSHYFFKYFFSPALFLFFWDSMT